MFTVHSERYKSTTSVESKKHISPWILIGRWPPCPDIISIRISKEITAFSRNSERPDHHISHHEPLNENCFPNMYFHTYPPLMKVREYSCIYRNSLPFFLYVCLFRLCTQQVYTSHIGGCKLASCSVP